MEAGVEGGERRREEKRSERARRSEVPRSTGVSTSTVVGLAQEQAGTNNPSGSRGSSHIHCKPLARAWILPHTYRGTPPHVELHPLFTPCLVANSSMGRTPHHRRAGGDPSPQGHRRRRELSAFARNGHGVVSLESGHDRTPP